MGPGRPMDMVRRPAGPAGMRSVSDQMTLAERRRAQAEAQAARSSAAQRPAAPVSAKPSATHAASSVANQHREKAPKKSKGRIWRAILQFAIGLLVVLGVAAAIVALYIRYYQ